MPASAKLPGIGITARILRDDGKTYAGVTLAPELYSAGVMAQALAAATGLSAGEIARAKNAPAIFGHYPREPLMFGSGWAIYNFPGSRQLYVLRDDGTHLSYGMAQTIFTPAGAAAIIGATAGLSGAELSRVAGVTGGY